jgi:hypothetical protein
MLNYFFPKIVASGDNVEKYGTARQTTGDIAHAHCILDN